MEIAIDHNFYQHINNSSFMTAPLLHKLCIDSAVPDGKRPPVFVLKSILQCCPALKELKIQTGDILGTFEDFRSKVSQSLSLEKLILHRGMGSSDALTAEICRGVIRTSELQALYLDDDPLHKHNAMVQEGFSISYVPYIRPEDYEAQLIGIMRQNFKLFTVTISCAPGRTRAILDALTDARKAVLLEGGSPAIRRANLRWVNQFDDFTTNPATMSIEFPSTVAADTISTNIGYSGAEEGWGVSFSMEDDEAFAEVLVQYGRFLDTLRMHSTFSDDMAVILNKVLKEQGSAITLLQLAPRSLTAVGLECMGGVIERSHNLAHLEIFSKDLQENSEQWKLEQLLVRYSRRFSRMILSGETPELWIPMVARMCPTRHELPELDLLYITYPDDQDTCPGDQYLPQECVRWIVAMVLPPPRTPATPLSPRPSRAIQEISGTLIDESDQINLVPLPTFSYPWMSLSDLALEMIGLQPQDWEAVIEALDFTALRNLEFSYSNFAQDQLQVLVDCIPEESNCPILLDIKLWYTGITESSQTRRMINALKEKAPHVSVYY
ncbi:hypothetical protein BGZ54_005467 [Gamsiella multidivaricata]|nr:hypothetical protein BGZ54_005467 [Gamsiella multidivaricata]